MKPHYVRLTNGDPFPELTSFKPFKAVLVIEERRPREWQKAASKWLVAQGCLYMMAWGLDCSTWDDSIDEANQDTYGVKEIPDDNFVMTTWHEDEELADVFWMCKNIAVHPSVCIRNSVIIHIGRDDREIEFMEEYMNATYNF